MIRRGCILASAVFFLPLCSCGANNASSQTAFYTVAPAITATQTPIPSPTPAPADTPYPAPTFAFIGREFCTIGTADIKDKPGYDGKTTGSVPNGAVVDIIGRREDGWRYVAYGGADGYVQSKYFKELHTPAVTVPSGDWDMIFVNPSHNIPDDFTPALADFESGQVDERIFDICNQMFADAENDGIDLKLVSAYRSRERQSKLYQRKVNSYTAKGYSPKDAETKAAAITARPGTSEHQTGLALDLTTPSHTSMNSGFAKTEAFAWLDENAYNYGFVLRYPKGKTAVTGVIYEPWHWRFVGVDAAIKIKASGQCLEEYLGILD